MTKRRLRARERALLDALSGDECRRVLAELVRSVAGASEIVEQAVTDLLGVVSVESVATSEGSNQQAIASVSMRDAPAGCQRLRSRPVSGSMLS